MKRSTDKALILFFVLVGYILLQFTWWEVLLVRQTSEVIAEKKNIVALSITNQIVQQQELVQLEKKQQAKIWMIIGEGTVFFIILSLGIVRVYNSYKKERMLFRNQKNFLLSITHELKTPIASLKLQIQTLEKRTDLSPEKKEQILKNAMGDIDRLNALVENILMSARIDSQTDLLSKEKINLSELIEQTYQLYFSNLQNHQLELNIAKDIYMFADPLAMGSVVINLIENAVKYSTIGSQISVCLKSNNNQLNLSVTDNGIGIPKSDKEFIFDKFYRAGNEETRNTKGTGLGLFIVKQLVEQHDGKISIKDNHPKGSIFEISFPI